MKNNQKEALNRLRGILLSEDQQRMSDLQKELQEIRRRLGDTDEWLEKLDPVLAEALARKIIEAQDEMAEALAPVIGPAIKRQIEDAREDFVDALYPVIGSTIRKSIAESMKKLIVTINDRIDKALSFQNILRRVKSKVTGISEAELALKDSVSFQVQEIFLIHKKTGILLSHASQNLRGNRAEQEIVSGMLTAIRDFAKTAFASGERELSIIQYEDLEIYLENGRHAYLAFVCTGIAPEVFKNKMRRTERQVHNRYYKQLRNFDGNTASFEACKGSLHKLIHDFSTRKIKDVINAKEKRTPRPAYWVLVLILLTGGYFSFKFLRTRQETQVASARHLSGAELQEIRARLSKDVQLDISGVIFVSDGKVLTIEGEVPNENDRILIGTKTAGIAPVPVVLNNLTIRKIVQIDSVDQNRKQIERTVIYFDKYKIAIPEKELIKMQSVVRLLRDMSFDTLYISGYSDSTGREQSNITISAKRAKAVKRFLTAANLDGDRIETIGLGSQNPAAPNDTEAGRSLNRRIEFSFSDER